jgi:hypothetical protein
MWNLRCTIIPVKTGTTGNGKLKAKSGSYTRKALDRFSTANSYTWNITHNTESTAVGNLKPERWGSPLVQGECREESL